MRSILTTFILLLLCTEAYSQSNLYDGMTRIMDGYDDATYHISMGHTFPYYGKTFTDAWMSTNGVILLYDPIAGIGNPGYNNSMCCTGQDLNSRNNFPVEWSYMIAPLWTDLVDVNQTPTDGFYYSTNQTETNFMWYNVKEFYDLNQNNTFGAKLNSSGDISFWYDDVNIKYHNVFIGYTGKGYSGDILDGTDYNQLLFSGGNLTTNDVFAFNDMTNSSKSSIDCSNVLNNISCPGHDVAYLDQQCSINQLYDSSCPRYSIVYLEQQCTINALYDSSCPNYNIAYFSQQCENDPLYNSLCDGYQSAVTLRDASGQNFIFGDDISDFYTTTSDPIIQEERTFDIIDEPIVEEVFEVVETYTVEPIVESYREEIQQRIEETPIIETIIEVEPIETITQVRENTIEIEREEIIVTQEIVTQVKEVEQQVSNIPSNIMSIISQLAENDNQFSKSSMDKIDSTASLELEDNQIELKLDIVLSQENSIESNNNSESSMSTSFGSIDSRLEEMQISAMVDPTISVITLVEDKKEDQQQSIELNSVSSQPTQGALSDQANQSFSTGQSITAVLNNVAPNFSQFNIAIPSTQEQSKVDKAESQANNMSNEQLEKNLDEFSSNLKDSGGFTDQSITIFLMGRVNGFDSYNTTLKDTSFYAPKDVYKSQKNYDNPSARILNGSSDIKFQQLIDLQY